MLIITTGIVLSILVTVFLDVDQLSKLYALHMRPSGARRLFGFGGMLRRPYNGPSDASKWLNRVNPKIEKPERVGNESYEKQMLWGTYRPNLYFGFKTRSAPAFVGGGLMWCADHRIGNWKNKNLRHDTVDGELEKWGWLKHDGKSYGTQEIVDKTNNMMLITSFVKPSFDEGGGVQFASRIEVTPLSIVEGDDEGGPMSIILYFGVDCDGYPQGVSDCLDIAGLSGGVLSARENVPKGGIEVSMETDVTGPIQIGVLSSSGTNVSFEGMADTTFEAIHNNILHKLKTNMAKNKTETTIIDQDIINALEDDGPFSNSLEEQSNVLAVRVSARKPFNVSFIVRHNDSESPSSRLSWPTVSDVDEWLRAGEDHFDTKFAEIYCNSMVVNEEYRLAGKAALSNCIGSLAYFHGNSLLKGDAISFDAELFTCVPSRGFFPRGFLWDEGFHQLLVSTWDASISLDVLWHWLSLLHMGPKSHPGAWIPREQILGSTSERRVPTEFRPQDPDVANPPTLLLLVQKLLDNKKVSDSDIKRLAPGLDLWVCWLLATLRAKGNKGFRWRGRDPEDKRVNPITLDSGLDDFPRAMHPSDEERHLDALCWMILSCQIMSRIQHLLPSNAPDYSMLGQDLLKEMKAVHWDGEAFWDLGMNENEAFGILCNATDGKQLRFEPPAEMFYSPNELQKLCPESHPHFDQVIVNKKYKPEPHLMRDGKKLQYVRHVGYVSIFPLILQLLDPQEDADELEAILKMMRSSKQLWSEHGLRSLSVTDPFYHKANARGDEPYWRGAVWININFLALKALRFYSNSKGHSSHSAGILYTHLRENLLKTVFGEFKRTGFFFEQYDDVTGSGRRSHPFTGWTACILNIFSEIY